IKVVTVILMILFGVYIIFWGNNGVSTVSNVFAQEKFFSSGLDGFLASFVVVIFSFGGTELVGIMAGESKNPQKAIPLATRSVIFRIILFYIATIFIILCLYPWQQFNDKFSVFVDVFNKIGITKAADIINFVIITAALSSFNSGIYGTGRMLYNLSLQQNAPNMFNKVNKSGVPYVATLFSIYVIFIVVLLNYKFPHKIFLILISVATSAAIINWLVILFIHHIFRKKVAKDLIVFKMPFYPYSSLLVVAFFIIVIFNMFKQPDMKTALFITPIWLLFLLLMFLCKKFKIFL
ncbi:MAG: amino acid permease, partial [Burkholderiales bacterium]|nr:amino acid permease [Burkholderiales bacterium]